MPESKDSTGLDFFGPEYFIQEAEHYSFELAPTITDKTLYACEQLIARAKADFFVDLAVDLAALQRLARGHASKEEVLLHTYNIHAHANILGFILITDICQHLIRTMNSIKIINGQRQALLTNLVTGLTLCFERKIYGDGGEVGAELRKRLDAYL